jgi:hypothetical protein
METFFEAIDDYLINWYFANEKDFEKPFQKSINRARFQLTNDNSSGDINLKALHITEDIFYTYVYSLFKKKEIELLQDYIKNNSYDNNFLKLYQSRKDFDTSFLDYLNSKIDFLKLRKFT